MNSIGFLVSLSDARAGRVIDNHTLIPRSGILQPKLFQTFSHDLTKLWTYSCCGFLLIQPLRNSYHGSLLSSHTGFTSQGGYLLLRGVTPLRSYSKCIQPYLPEKWSDEDEPQVIFDLLFMLEKNMKFIFM